ncbi:MAG: rhombotarget lipoprotein [Woeseiaceae bacterium]
MLKRSQVIGSLLPLLAGCGTLWHGGGYQDIRDGASSSLVDFLYPNGEIPPRQDDRLPSLELPLRVGLAFVPAHGQRGLSAAEKQVLLERVAEAFRDRPFVSAIEIIPDSYLRAAKGLHGMQQVASLFGVDVTALVSYDQLTISGERDSSLLYWTIVGALVVKGNTNEVHTMIDTAVFDARSTSLLFRAPGIHAAQRNATLIDMEQDLRRLSAQGFGAATDDMIINLNHELENFRVAVERGERANVEWREGHGGGGRADSALVFALAMLLIARRSGRTVIRRGVIRTLKG